MKFPLYLTWALAVILLIMINFYFTPSDESFLGYVDTFEVATVSQFGGQISQINVKEGDAVKSGQVLLQLLDLNLDIEINKTQHERRKILLEKGLTEKLTGKSSHDLKYSSIDLALLEISDRLNYLNQKKMSLTLKATYDGIVGKIEVFTGQYVSAYQPLLTVYHAKPNTIIGFLVEEGVSKLQVGSIVTISSYSDPSKQASGVVSSIGQRFIDLPPRLKTTYTASSIAWGREIQISLPENHKFLPAEKVKIGTGNGFVRNYYQKVIALKQRLNSKS